MNKLKAHLYSFVFLHSAQFHCWLRSKSTVMAGARLGTWKQQIKVETQEHVIIIGGSDMMSFGAKGEHLVLHFHFLLCYEVLCLSNPLYGPPQSSRPLLIVLTKFSYKHRQDNNCWVQVFDLLISGLA